jgi:hypothetical protein
LFRAVREKGYSADSTIGSIKVTSSFSGLLQQAQVARFGGFMVERPQPKRERS